MATQEPNVYAGLAVVIGGLMHARPRFFAKVMGELLFWVGEDKMLFGSDYGIWEPKWQIEGLVDWDYPDDDEYSRLPARSTSTGKKKILGLNAAKLYGIEVPDGAAAARAGRGARGRRRTRSWSSRREPDARGVLAALGDGLRPGARRADHRRSGSSAPCVVTADGDVEVRAAAADAAVRAELRVPDGGRRARRGAPRCRGCASVDVVLEDHYTGDGDQRRGRARATASPARSRARPTTASSSALRELFQRKALVARQARLCEALLAAGRRRARSWRCASPTCPATRTRARCLRAARGSSAIAARRRRAGVRRRRRRAARAPSELERWLRMARLVRD